MTEEKLEREENERDALDAVGGHECPSGISVEVVVSAVVTAVAVVNIKTLTMQSIAHKFATGWFVVKMCSVETQWTSVAGHLDSTFCSQTREITG
jgi:hypothetical protein